MAAFLERSRAAIAEWNWAAIGANLGLGLATVALVLLAAGPLGWRLGWWHYSFAFFWLLPTACFAALAAVLVSILTLALGWPHTGGRGLAVAIIAVALGAVVAYVPWHYDRVRKTVPPIHDITTDTENPPAFVAALKLRPPGSDPVSYAGPAVAGKPRAAYADR